MIRGSLIHLRPARESDRRAVYEWMAHSDVTSFMFGPPLFPETPIPSWDEFCADYVSLFFDGSQPDVGRSYIIEHAGEAIGHVGYSQVDLGDGRVELDIWLRSAADCGHGYGNDTLRALVEHLHETMGITDFVIRPSPRNPRAIRAYAKAGFVVQSLSAEQQWAMYGPPDYDDTVVMIKKVVDSSRAK